MLLFVIFFINFNLLLSYIIVLTPGLCRNMSSITVKRKKSTKSWMCSLWTCRKRTEGRMTSGHNLALRLRVVSRLPGFYFSRFSSFQSLSMQVGRGCRIFLNQGYQILTQNWSDLSKMRQIRNFFRGQLYKTFQKAKS